MDNEQNNSNDIQNDKISIPPIFKDDFSQEPTQIDASSVSKDINPAKNIQGNNNIFKIPIQTQETNADESTGNPANDDSSNQESMKDNSSVYQSTSNEATLDKDNPVPQMNNMDADDEELIKSFVGIKYNNFQKPFNIFAFLFGGAYYFYRKMFLYGLVLFIINLILLNVIKIWAVTVLFRIVLGFFTNKIYLAFAYKKVKKIKYIKSQESIEEILRICAAKGGTSVLQIILGVLVDLIIALVVALLLLVVTGVSFLGAILNNASFTATDKTVNINDYFAIGVPSVFKDESSSYEMNYTYSKSGGTMDSCVIKLYGLKDVDSPKQALDKVTGRVKDEYTTKTINNADWQYAYVESINKTYYYAIEKNNKVFVLEYVIQPNADSSCSSYYDSLMTMVVVK